jgi:hypothetical protein
MWHFLLISVKTEFVNMLKMITYYSYLKQEMKYNLDDKIWWLMQTNPSLKTKKVNWSQDFGWTTFYVWQLKSGMHLNSTLLKSIFLLMVARPSGITSLSPPTLSVKSWQLTYSIPIPAIVLVQNVYWNENHLKLIGIIFIVMT